MFIATNDLREWIVLVVTDIDVIDTELNFLVFSFLPLDTHYFLNCLFNVKVLKVVPKFIPFDLCEV